MIIDMEVYLNILESYLEVQKQISGMSWKLVYNNTGKQYTQDCKQYIKH